MRSAYVIIVLLLLSYASSLPVLAQQGGGGEFVEYWGPAAWTGRYLVVAHGNMLVVDGGGGISLPDKISGISVVDQSHVVVVMGSAIVYVELSNTPIPLWSFSPGCEVVAAYSRPFRGGVVVVGYSSGDKLLYVYLVNETSGVWREIAVLGDVDKVFAANLVDDKVLVAIHTTRITVSVTENITENLSGVRFSGASIAVVDAENGETELYPVLAYSEETGALWTTSILSSAPTKHGLLVALRTEKEVPNVNYTGPGLIISHRDIYKGYSFLALVSSEPSILGFASTCQKSVIVDVTGDVFAVACEGGEESSLKIYVYDGYGIHGSYGYALGDTLPLSVDARESYVAIAWGEGAYIVNATTGIPFAYFAEPVGYVYFFADKVLLGEVDGYRVVPVTRLGSLSVTVYAVNETVPGVFVRAGDEYAVTDEAGRAVFILPPGPVYVEVLFDDGRIWRGAAYVVAGAETNLFVHHEDSEEQPIWDRYFMLRVAAAPAEAPDERLTSITVYAVNLLTGDEYNASTDEKETEAVLNIRGGAYRVTISAPNRAPASYNIIVADDTALVARLELIKYRVNIQAIDAITGAPISAIVKVDKNTTTTNKPLYLPYGEYKITVSAPGYKTVTKTIVVEEDMNITIRMFRETYRVEVTVYGLSILPPGNIPIQRAGVCVDDTCDVTDAEGKTALTLTAGTYTLKISHPDYLEYHAALNVPEQKEIKVILNPSPILIARQVGPIIAVVGIAVGIYIYLRRRQMKWLAEKEELFLGEEGEQPPSET